MRRAAAAVLVAVVVFPARAGAATPRERLADALFSHARPWVSYYGGGRIAALRHFGVLDIDAELGAGNYTAQEVASLKAGGSIVLSYLNVGAAETFRSYWNRVRRFQIEPYEGYPGEFWMKVHRAAYRRVLLERVASQLVAAGVDGFYLDNLDIVQERFATKATRRGVIRFIAALRARYPDHVVVAQNGLDIIRAPSPDGTPLYELVDAVAKEDASSTFGGGGYRKVPPGSSDRLLDELSGIGELGLPVLTLDYANSEGLARYATDRSRARGFFPYVCVIDLDRVCSPPG